MKRPARNRRFTKRERALKVSIARDPLFDAFGIKKDPVERRGIQLSKSERNARIARLKKPMRK